ncbi:MAG: hypothetical protein ACK496_07780 [Acidobacteriota bacterium]
MDIKLLVVLLVALSLLIRAYPRIKLKNVYASDTYFHLYCAKHIKNSKYTIPLSLPRVLLPHRYTYPYLYHYLLSLFSDKNRLTVERYTGAVTDTLSMLVCYVYSSNISQYVHQVNIALNADLIVMLLYLLSPALLRIGSGPRAYNGSPRTVGQLLYIIHVLSCYTYYKNGQVLQLAICLLTGALIIITGKFSTQVLLFFGVLFTVFYAQTYLLIIIACFVLSVLVSNGKSVRILLGQLEHTVLYARYFQSRFLYPHLKTFKQYRDTVRIVCSNFNFKNCVEWLLVVERHPLHLFVTLYPHLIVLFFILIRGVAISDFDKFLLIWLMSGVLLYILTKLRLLLFLGEGERYVEYALFPSLYLFVKYTLLFMPAAIVVFLLYYIFCTVVYLEYFISRFKTQNDSWHSTSICYQELDKYPSGILWPIGSFHFQALVRSKNHLVLSHGANVEKQTMDQFNIIYENYPYPSGRFAEIVKTYGVNYIISDEQHINHYKKCFVNNPGEFESLTELIAESPILKVWRIKKDS